MAIARRLAGDGVDALYSYAGRTTAPEAPPLPHRIGGFGGPEGLAAFLRDKGIRAVIDATHPFAAGMSRNALAACTAEGVPLIALERAPWVEEPGDQWSRVPDIAAAVHALPVDPTRIFLAIGRQTLAPFAARDHRYLLRLVDAPAADPLPGATVIVDRGPFTLAGDLALMQREGVQLIVAKNAGGSGAFAKIEAARRLRLPVVMIDRPAIPPRRVAASVDEVMVWLHGADLGV